MSNTFYRDLIRNIYAKTGNTQFSWQDLKNSVDVSTFRRMIQAGIIIRVSKYGYKSQSKYVFNMAYIQKIMR